MSQTRSWWSLEHSHVVSSTPRNLFFQFNIKKSPNLHFIVLSTFKSTNPSYFEKKWVSDLVDVWFFFPRKSFTLPSGISFWNIVGTSHKRWVSLWENPERNWNVFHFYQIYIMVKRGWKIGLISHTFFSMKKWKSSKSVCDWTIPRPVMIEFSFPNLFGSFPDIVSCNFFILTKNQIELLLCWRPLKSWISSSLSDSSPKEWNSQHMVMKHIR